MRISSDKPSQRIFPGILEVLRVKESMTIINSHNQPAIENAFKKVSNPKDDLWFSSLGISDVNIPIEYNGVKAGVDLTSFWKALSKTKRLDWARYRWLRPQAPLAKLDELPGIQKAAGLDYIAHEVFLHELIQHCTEFQRDNQELSIWARRRIALLQIALKRTIPIPDTLVHAKSNYLRGLLTAYGNYSQSKELSEQTATRILQSCLKSAAISALSTFTTDAHDWSIEANMMVPLNLPGENELSANLKENADKSKDIWGPCNSDKALMVVAEMSPSPTHLGFWAPIKKGTSGEFIPGAPKAFETAEGCAVFKNDLPLFQGFGDGVTHKWRAYMSDHFQHSMFISLPVIVYDDGVLRTIAVLNINVTPPDSHEAIYQAYHTERLKDAQNRAAYFMQLAFFALLLQPRDQANIGNFLIDTGVANWQNLGDILLLPES